MTHRLALPAQIPARASLVAALLVATVTTLPLAGCRDGDDQTRVAAQAKLNEVADGYRRVMALQTADSDEATVRDLEALLSGASSITSDANKGSASLLASNIARSIGEISLSEIRGFETAARHERSIIATTAAAAASLDSLADAQSNISLAEDRQLLQQQKSSAEAALKLLQDTVNRLQEPIAQLQGSTEAKRTNLAELRGKAEELRRRANDSDPISALAYVESGAEVKGEARGVRSSLALEEIQLRALEPDLEVANQAVSSAQAVAAAATAAMGELENFSLTLKTDAEATRKRADELRGLAEGALAKLAQDRSELFAPAYEKAQAMFEKAVAAAGAVSGDLGKAGGQAKLAAQAGLGALFAEQTAGESAQLALHDRLASLGDLFGGEAKQREAIEAIKTKRDESLAKAKEAYTAALDALASMNPENPDVVRARSAIDGSVASLEGRVAASAPASPAAAANGGAASTLVVTGPGFPSKDSLVAAFSSADENPLSALASVKKAFAFQSPDSRPLFEATMGLVDAMMPLLEAVQEKFGPDGLQQMSAQGLGAGGMDPFGGRFERVDRGEKTFLRMQSQGGGTEELELVEVGGAWYVQGDSAFGGSDPQTREMAKLMLPMLAGMQQSMRTLANEMAGRIRSGEITSVEDLQKAMQDAAAKSAPGFGAGG